MIRYDSAVSYANSEYYKWFVELGYPRLDIVSWDDGEWAIRQFQSLPVVPSMTKWNYILTGLRNVDKSRSFVEKYVELIDTTKKAFWEREDAMTEAAEKRIIDKDKFQKESIERKFEACRNNPELMERCAKFGMGQMSLYQIFKNLTPYERRRLRK